MSEADWIPSPITEREAMVLGRQARWRPLNVWIAGSSCVAAMGCFVALGWAFNYALGVGSMALDLLGFLVFSALPCWLAIRDAALVRSVAAPDLTRREEFGAGQGWLVQLTIHQGAAPTGEDRGMLWIESGRLCFSGDRTSFALAPGQALATLRQMAVGGLRRATRLPLLRQTTGGPLALSFDVADDLHGEGRRTMRRTLDEWVAGGRAVEGQFPPTSIGPSARSPWSLFIRAGLATLTWAGVLWLSALSFLAEGLVLSLVCIVFGFALGTFGLGSPFLRWRAWADRRRLDRFLRQNSQR